MAMLGAIESLLCAVVLDGMTGTKHKANSELIGQGLGNIVAPFFGGITATAAIARSAANVRAGATSPVAAVIHALLVPQRGVDPGGTRRWGAGAAVRRRGGNRRGGSDPAEERRDNVAQPLANQLAIGFVLGAGHAIKHHRAQQRFNGA